MKDYTKEELIELAEYGEEKERSSLDPMEKRAGNALRMGADWMLRVKVRNEHQNVQMINKVQKPEVKQ